MVVLADSHGDEIQAQRTLTGTIIRHPDAPVAERAAAWACLAELRRRLDDEGGAEEAVDQVKSLAGLPDLSTTDQDAVTRAAREVAEWWPTPSTCRWTPEHGGHLATATRRKGSYGQNLVLKVVVTPLLIGAASLAGRRRGHHFGGWLVGLQSPSRPVAYF